MAQFRDTFVIAGGYDDGAYLDAVYLVKFNSLFQVNFNLNPSIPQYEPLSDSWAPSPENMTHPRYGATAIAVPTTVFPDCE